MKVREVYKIPANLEIVSILPIGYPSEDAKPNERHEDRNAIDKMVFWDNIN